MGSLHSGSLRLRSASAALRAQERLLIFDFLESTLHSFKKDKERKEFPLSSLASVKGGSSLELTIGFKDSHPYYMRCRCAEQYETLLEILRRVTSSAELTDASLNLLVDDETSPPTSVQKSKVIKRAESSPPAWLG